jgi:hypothetical protein
MVLVNCPVVKQHGRYAVITGITRNTNIYSYRDGKAEVLVHFNVTAYEVDVNVEPGGVRDGAYMEEELIPVNYDGNTSGSWKDCIWKPGEVQA